jgi:YbgC/YbaW family acyl-CoA thioester hydrolase
MTTADHRGFHYRRRVQFHETDLAGVVHFSCFFRYMEEAEHALWRAAGLTIDRAGAQIGWPRISASFDFKAPLRFEDEFDVIVRIADVTSRTITYGFEMRRGDVRLGVGTVTAACVRRDEAGGMRSTEIPPEIVDRLRRNVEPEPRT